jgi:DNA-binding Lrp family transcriptional regulator
MWFTLIAPSKARAAGILAEIRSSTGLDQVLDLPAVRLFKIRVIFPLDGNGEQKTPSRPQEVRPAQEEAPCFSPRERILIRTLQTDLELEPAPFARLAEKFALSEEEVIQGIADLLAAGVVRRFGPALRHRQAGFPANAMVVWRVPEERALAVGKALAAAAEVTHCYQRVRLAAWPYNIYTMIHGPDRAFCRRATAGLAETVGIEEYELLFSTAELKKSSMRYLLEEAEKDG